MSPTKPREVPWNNVKITLGGVQLEGFTDVRWDRAMSKEERERIASSPLLSYAYEGSIEFKLRERKP